VRKMEEGFKKYERDVNGESSFKQFYEKAEDFNKKLKEIISKVLVQGQLIVVANKQMGKTNSTMHLVRTLLQSQEHEDNKYKTLIFDLPLVWRFRFDKIPYVDISKTTYLPIVKDLLIDIPYTDSVMTRNAIVDVMREDFVRKRRLKIKFEGQNPFLNIYVVEEMQDVWGTYSLNGNVGRSALKIFAECANYGMIIIGITQRLADVITKIIGRSKYLLIGSLQEDNDLKKVKRFASQEVSEKVKSLKRGEFLFWDRTNKEFIDLIYFPKFDNHGQKPYPYKKGQSEAGYVKRIFLSS